MGRRLPLLVAAALITILFVASALAQEETDLIKIKRDILISADMTVNDVVVIYGTATVYGSIKGDLVVLGGDAYLKGSGRVGGEVVIVGGELIKESSASIAGKVTQVSMPSFIPSLNTLLHGGWLALWAAIGILALVGFLGIAILAAALIPGHMSAMVAALDHSYGMVFLWGLLGLILVLPVAFLLAISIVGIVLIPVEVLLVTLALIIGYIVSAIYVGRRIFQAFKKKVSIFLDVIAGIAVLYMVGFLPVLGSIVKAIFLIVGFGAVLVTRFGTAKRG